MYLWIDGCAELKHIVYFWTCSYLLLADQATAWLEPFHHLKNKHKWKEANGNNPARAEVNGTEIRWIHTICVSQVFYDVIWFIHGDPCVWIHLQYIIFNYKHWNDFSQHNFFFIHRKNVRRTSCFPQLNDTLHSSSTHTTSVWQKLILLLIQKSIHNGNTMNIFIYEI